MSSRKRRRRSHSGRESRRKTGPTPRRPPNRIPLTNQISTIATRFLSALRKCEYDVLTSELFSSASVSYFKLYVGTRVLESLNEDPAPLTVAGMRIDLVQVADQLADLLPDTVVAAFDGIRDRMEEAGFLSLSTDGAEHVHFGSRHLLVLQSEGKPFPLPFEQEHGNYYVDFKTLMVFSTYPDAQSLYEVAMKYRAAEQDARALYFFKVAAELGQTYDVLDHLFTNNLRLPNLVTEDRREHIQAGAQYVALARRRALEIEDMTSRELDIVEVIRGGEGQTVEFKREIPKQAQRLAEEIAAFATSNYGHIYLGIDDDGTVFGLTDAKTAQEKDSVAQRIQGIAANTVNPPAPIRIRHVSYQEPGTESKTITVVSVLKGPEAIYYVNHRPMVRDGQSSRPATPSEVTRLTCRNDEIS